MLRYIAFIVLAIIAAPIGAHAQRIESAKITGYGIFGAGESKSETDPSISTGQRVNHDGTKLVKHTSTIALHEGENKLIFGAEVALKGSPRGYAPRIRVVWLYPRPGLANPNTGKVSLRDEYEVTDWKVGNTYNFYWTLDASAPGVWVPGRWTLQLWQGDRLLAEQAFELVKV